MTTQKLSSSFSDKRFILIALIIALLDIIVIYNVLGVIYSYRLIEHQAKIISIGVKVYLDSNCTESVENIDWGIIQPNSTTTTDTLFIKSVSSMDIILSLFADNFNPINASDYLFLSWNYTDNVLTPYSIIPTELYLYVLHNITDITTFSFDIVIMSTEI